MTGTLQKIVSCPEAAEARSRPVREGRREIEEDGDEAFGRRRLRTGEEIERFLAIGDEFDVAFHAAFAGWRSSNSRSSGLSSMTKTRTELSPMVDAPIGSLLPHLRKGKSWNLGWLENRTYGTHIRHMGRADTSGG